MTPLRKPKELDEGTRIVAGPQLERQPGGGMGYSATEAEVDSELLPETSPFNSENLSFQSWKIRELPLIMQYFPALVSTMDQIL